MQGIKLRIVSPEGVEAVIECRHLQDGADDYYSLVSVNALNSAKKVYGIDPVQSFALAMHFVEHLTQARRLEGGETGPVAGAKWRIEIDTNE
ncbi:MAG: hypothetical protein ACFCUR_04770 [Rhodomicrobiaceae bacterium]